MFKQRHWQRGYFFRAGTTLGVAFTIFLLLLDRSKNQFINAIIHTLVLAFSIVLETYRKYKSKAIINHFSSFQKVVELNSKSNKFKERALLILQLAAILASLSPILETEVEVDFENCLRQIRGFTIILFGFLAAFENLVILTCALLMALLNEIYWVNADETKLEFTLQIAIKAFGILLPFVASFIVKLLQIWQLEVSIGNYKDEDAKK